MPDDNNDYYRPSLGTLSGFDKINLPEGNQKLPNIGWSLESLRRWLQNEDAINFPTDDWIQQVGDQITNHIDNHNNPHHVTISQLTSSFSRDVLGSVIAGTPPYLSPFFAYDAVCSLPFGDVFPATFSTVNIYRMNEGNMFINPSTEVEILGTDFINNKPGIPMFSSVKNMVVPTWASQPNKLINTSIIQVSHANISYPFNFYTLFEKNVTGKFGITIPFQSNSVNYCTFSTIVFPTVTGGSVIISQTGNTTDTMTVDLTSGEYSCSTAAIMGETFVYPSGAIRISFGFKPGVGATTGSVDLVHLNDDTTSPSRAGVLDRSLFTIVNPSFSNSPVNHPFVVNSAQVGSSNPLVLNLDKIPSPPYIANLLLSVSLHLYPLLPGSPNPDTVIMSFDTLQIERDNENIHVRQDGDIVFSTPILEGLNTISLSYSPTMIIFKDSINPRQELEGAYPTLSTTLVKFGPFAGYLLRTTMYAMDDTTKCVEFLSNA